MKVHCERKSELVKLCHQVSGGSDVKKKYLLNYIGITDGC